MTTSLPVDSESGGSLIINADLVLGISLSGLVPANTTIRYEYGFTVDSLCMDTVIVGVFDNSTTFQIKVYTGAANDSGQVTIPTTQNVSFAIAVPAQNCEIRLDYFRAYAMLIQPVTVCDTVRYVDLKDGYRFGFGGHESVDEITGVKNHYTALYWEYNPRLERRWNVDPVYKHHLSNYSIMSGNPVLNIDPNGANDTKYYDEDTKELIADIDDGIDQSVKVNRGQFEEATKLAAQSGFNLNNQPDARKFTDTYQFYSRKLEFLSFEITSVR